MREAAWGLAAPKPLPRALRPWTSSRTSGPAPGPLFFAPPKKRGEKKGGPTLRSPLRLRLRGSLRCAQAGPGQNSRRSLRSLCSNKLAEPEGSRAYGTRAVLLCSSAAQRGWDGQIPNSQLSARCLPSTARGSVFGCWLLGFSPPLRRRAAQTRGPCAAGALRDLTRAACLSGESRRRAQRVLRVAPLSSSAGNPLGPLGQEGERSAGPPFFSPLFFGGAKKRGSGPGPKVLVGGPGAECPRTGSQATLRSNS
jgi:hypothetical protein